jgi:hypothetical protein
MFKHLGHHELKKKVEVFCVTLMIATHWKIVFDVTMVVLLLVDKQRTWLYTILYFANLFLLNIMDMSLMATTASRLIRMAKESEDNVQHATDSNKKTHIMMSRLLHSQMLFKTCGLMMMGLFTIYYAYRGYNYVDNLPLLPETDLVYFLRYISLMLSIIMPVMISGSFALCTLVKVDNSAEAKQLPSFVKMLTACFSNSKDDDGAAADPVPSTSGSPRDHRESIPIPVRPSNAGVSNESV